MPTNLTQAERSVLLDALSMMLAGETNWSAREYAAAERAHAKLAGDGTPPPGVICLLECPAGEHTFRAVGATLSQARRAMLAALRAHAKAHGKPRTWVHGMCTVEYELAPGVGYCDMQPLTEPQPEAAPGWREVSNARKKGGADATK